MLIKKGEKIIINKEICNNLDLLEWYEKRSNKILVVQNVQKDTNEILVEDCPYKINFSKIIVLNTKNIIFNYIEKCITSWEIENEYNRGEHKAGILIKEFFRKTNDIETTIIFVESLKSLNETIFKTNLENNEFEEFSFGEGFKDTCDRLFNFLNELKNYDRDKFLKKWEEEITL